MNPVNSRSVPTTTDRVHIIIGRVPATVGRMSKEIIVEYHICLTPYRAEPGTSDMFHRWIRYVQWSET
jgi:hypothetical protein